MTKVKLMSALRLLPHNDGGFVHVGSRQRFVPTPEWNELVMALADVRLTGSLPAVSNEVLEIISNSGAVVSDYASFEPELPAYLKRNSAYLELLDTQLSPPKILAVLQGSSVAILGVGGLGSMVATLLAAAGVGRLTIVDSDCVESSNLNRQFSYRTVDVGQAKVVTLSNYLSERFPKTEVTPINSRITRSVLRSSSVAQCSTWICTADEPLELPLLVNECAVNEHVPCLYAGYIGDCAVVGPYVKVPDTGCLACGAATFGIKQDTHSTARLDSDLMDVIMNINRNAVVPSFGTLNVLTASLAAESIIQVLSTDRIPNAVRNRRLGFFLRTFATDALTFDKCSACSVCTDHQETAQ